MTDSFYSLEFINTIKIYMQNEIKILLGDRIKKLKHELYMTILKVDEETCKTVILDDSLLKIKELIDSLFEQSYSDISIEITNKSNIKQNNKIKSDTVIVQCIAKTGAGTRCSRKSIKDSKFCKYHTTRQPFSIFDKDLLNVPFVQLDDIKQLDEYKISDYIQTNIYTINDTEYLISEDGILYDIDANIKGRLISASTIEWFD